MFSAFNKTIIQPKYLLLIGAIVACILLNASNLSLDFWCDETQSLREFQLVPIHTTLTDYHDVNNHIFFNLLCNIYLKATGQQRLINLLWHPERLRILLLVITCASVWMLWLLSLELGGIKLALINLVLLLTTVPFYNYTLQLRSYGLSIFLLLAMLRYLYQYYTKQHIRSLVWVSVWMILLIYTHPANIYLATSLFPGFLLVGLLAGQWSKAQRQRFILSGWLGMMIAIGVSFLLYLPMYHLLFTNIILRQLHYDWSFFYNVFGYNTYYFLSMRALAFAGCLAGLFGFYKINRRDFSGQYAFFWCCAMVYMACYLISFLRKDAPMVRIFVPELVLFLLPLGLGIYWFHEWMDKRYKNWLLIILLGSCAIAFPCQIAKRNKVILENIALDRFSENLFTDWHMYHYEPARIIDAVKKYKKANEPLILCLSWYNHDEQDYLNAMDIPYFKCATADSVTAGKPIWYVITSHPKSLKQASPTLHVTKMNEGIYSNNLYRIMRR